MARQDSAKIIAQLNQQLIQLRTSGELGAEGLRKVSKVSNELMQIEIQMAKATQSNTKGTKDLLDANTRITKEFKEREKVEKKRLQLQNKLTTVGAKQRKELAALRIEEQRRNKLSKQQAQLDNKNLGAFERLNVKIKQLSDQYRNLVVAEGKETRETKRLRKQILLLNKTRDQANMSLGMHQSKVGQYERSLGKLKGMLAQLGLAFGVFHILRDTFGIIKSFDQALTDLAAISGKTEEQLAPLKKQALDLGATTQYTASQITGLQIELAKLGFTVDEIAASTGPISKLATATGADLASAASLAGATLRAFGLDATEMDRVTSVLAVSTTKSALSFEFLNSAMSTIAPVAKAFGFSIEDTTALLGTLANSGFDASSAATATRNILLNLADANGKLAQELGRPITNVEELGAALTELKDRGVNLADALELTDKRSVAAFNTFLEGSDTLSGFKDSITGVSGELDEMAAKKLDSISGAVDLFRSAWEGVILEWSEGKGAGEAIKNVIMFLANNLKTIIKVLVGGIKVWVLYRLQLKLFRFEVDEAGKRVAVGLLPSLRNTVRSLKASARGFKLASFSVKTFGNALKTIPFLAIISGITTVISLFSDMGSEMDEAEQQTSALDDAIKEINDRYVDESAELKNVFLALKDTTAGSKERQEVIDNINSKYGTTLENLSDEEQFVYQVDAAYNQLLNTLKEKVRFDVTQERRLELVKQLVDAEDRLVKARKSTFDLAIAQGMDSIEVSQEELLIKKEIRELEAMIGELDTGPLPGTEPGGGGGGGPSDREKEMKDEFEQARQTLADLRKINKENLTAIELDMRKSGKTQEEIDEALHNQKIKNLVQETDFALRHLGEFSNEYIALELDLNKEIENTTQKRNKTQLELNEQLFKDFQEQNRENLKILEINMMAQGKTDEEIQREMSKKRLETLKEELDKALELFGSNSPEFLEAYEKYLKAPRGANEQTVKEFEEAVKDLRKSVSEAIELWAHMLEKSLESLDRQIEHQSQLAQDHKDREQQLMQIAEDRKLNADESLTAEREAQKRALEEQRKLQNEKERVQALIAALQLLAKSVESGSANPVIDVKNKINSIKSYVDGTFYTGGYTGDGGKYDPAGIVHRGEFVVDKETTAALGLKGKTMGDFKSGEWIKDGFLADIAKRYALADKLSFESSKKPPESKLASKLDKLIEINQKKQADVGKMAFDMITGMATYKQGGTVYLFPTSKK